MDVGNYAMGISHVLPLLIACTLPVGHCVAGLPSLPQTTTATSSSTSENLTL
jgi:hypothetical protein